MQIPQRAERAGETGVQGSVLLRGWARAGGRVLNDNTGCIEILLVQSSLCGTSSLVSFSLFDSKCRQKEREPAVVIKMWRYDRSAKSKSLKFYWFKCNLVQKHLEKLILNKMSKKIRNKVLYTNLNSRTNAYLQAPVLISVTFDGYWNRIFKQKKNK